MRNFGEIKAEVLRRSEDRIKERKRKRKRVITFCVPLCVVLAVCSLTVFPLLSDTNKGNAQPENKSENMADSDVGFVSVEISGYNVYEKITDIDKINQIYSAFTDLHYNMKPGASDTDAALKDETIDFGNSSAEDDSGEKSGLKIYFKTSGGDEIQFVMTYGQLYNTDSGVKTYLSEKRTRELLELLGIAY